MKIGRNSLCPCNSGKKYKKCHGIKNVLEINPAPYNYELSKLRKGLFAFALSFYGEEMEQMLKQYRWPSSEIAEKKRIQFRFALISWLIVQKRLDEERTIASIFIKREKGKIKDARVQNKFSNWTNVVPSLYKILAITEEAVQVRDCRTNQMLLISNVLDKQLQVGNYLFGTLLSFVKYAEPFLEMVTVPEDAVDFIEKVTSLSDEDFRVLFPRLLLESVEQSTRKKAFTMKLEKPINQLVITLFTEKMQEKAAPKILIEKGIAIWKKFVTMEKPNFQKPSGFAAAMEWIVYELFEQTERPVQRHLAARYEISPNTLKRNVEKFYLSYRKNPETYRNIIVEASKEEQVASF